VTDYLKSGVHVLNAWLWTKLDNFVWNEVDRAFAFYDSSGLIPIIPAQEEPEFVNAAQSAPFIVYNYIVTSKTGNQFYMMGDRISYVIYDSDESRLRAIFNYLNDLLYREDWTAQDINSAGVDGQFNALRVTHVNAFGPDAYDDEGGRRSAVVNVVFEYAREMDDRGLRK
jgi:hypothetical protein